MTLPIALNDGYSGMIAGKSSALYMLVFNHVMREVLGRSPIPVLVPMDWNVFQSGPDSLVNAFLSGRRV